MESKREAVSVDFGGPTPSYDLGHQEFAFVDYGNNQPGSLQGSLNPAYTPTGQHATFARSDQPKTRAAGFLESKGLGWLMERDPYTEQEEDEKPLLEELDIDPRDIYYKIRCVLLPLPYFRLKLQLVRESPDFWGPLFVVLAYALISLYGQFRVVSWILTIWFCGSFIIFFLARVLGGEVGYSQCLGVIGYCLIPLVVTGAIIPWLHAFSYINFFIKAFGVCWAVYSAGTLLCGSELREKKLLLLYPIFLLYVYFFSLYTGV